MTDAGEETSRFYRRASLFGVAENLAKVLEPALVFVCIALYAGGDWGQYKYYESLALVLMRLACFGLDKGLLWYVNHASTDTPGVYFWRAISFSTLITLACAGLYMLLRAGVVPIAMDGALPPLPLLHVALYVGSVPLYCAMTLALHLLIARKVLRFNLLSRYLVLPLVAYGLPALLASTPLRGHALPGAFFLGHLVACAVSLVGLTRHIPGLWRQISLNPFLPGQLLRFAWPIASTEFAMVLVGRTDIWLLTAWKGLAAVEIYTLVVMIGNAVTTVRLSFDPLLVSITSQHSQDRKPGAEALHSLRYFAWYSLALQVPLLALFLLAGDWFLALILPGHPGSGLWLVTYAAFLTLSTLGVCSAQMLLGLGRSWIVPLSQVVFFVFNLILNILLIPPYGPGGAAFATGISYCAGYSIVYWVARWLIGQPLLDRATVLGILRLPWLYLPLVLTVPWHGVTAASVLVFACSTALYVWLVLGAARRATHHAVTAVPTVDSGATS